MKPAAGMTGYTLGPTIFVLLLNVFFNRAWLGDAEARGLTDQQAQNALDVATQAAANSSPVVPYNPYLVQQTVEVARADYSTGVMITMLIITVVPLVVAALAYFLIPPALNRRHKPLLPVANGQNSLAPRRRSSKGRFL
jgi:hypothetical protein